jgi:hypothetical protein
MSKGNISITGVKNLRPGWAQKMDLSQWEFCRLGGSAISVRSCEEIEALLDRV